MIRIFKSRSFGMRKPIPFILVFLNKLNRIISTGEYIGWKTTVPNLIGATFGTFEKFTWGQVEK